MADFNISNFKDNIARRGGFSRGIFFECAIAHNSADLRFNQNDTYACKSVNLPSETLDFTSVKFYTREIKIPGSRTFSPVTISFYNTTDYSLRTRLYIWLNLFNSNFYNVRGTSPESVATPPNITELYGTVMLTAYENQHPVEQDSAGRPRASETPKILAYYKFLNAYPTSLAGLQFSQEDDATFQSYDVEFQYSRMVYEPGPA